MIANVEVVREPTPCRVEALLLSGRLAEHDERELLEMSRVNHLQDAGDIVHGAGVHSGVQRPFDDEHSLLSGDRKLDEAWIVKILEHGRPAPIDIGYDQAVVRSVSLRCRPDLAVPPRWIEPWARWHDDLPALSTISYRQKERRSELRSNDGKL